MEYQIGNRENVDTKIGYFNKEPSVMTLYVGNLGFDMTENEIKNLFESHGNVNYVKLVKDQETQESKGIAFLQIANRKHARIAISKLNGAVIDGRTLKVSIAEETDPDRIPKKKRRKPYKAYVSKAERADTVEIDSKA